MPDPAADDYNTVPGTESTQNSENEFCMEVHGTVDTEPTYDDDTKDDEDLNKRVIVTRVALTDGQRLDLEEVIAKKEIQWHTVPNCQDDHLSQPGFTLTLRCSLDVNLDMSI